MRKWHIGQRSLDLGFNIKDKNPTNKIFSMKSNAPNVHRNHQPIHINNIKILSKNFQKTNEKRKISEALFIRSFKPIIDVNGTSTPLIYCLID